MVIFINRIRDVVALPFQLRPYARGFRYQTLNFDNPYYNDQNSSIQIGLTIPMDFDTTITMITISVSFFQITVIFHKLMNNSIHHGFSSQV